jgi:hypothetical protein
MQLITSAQCQKLHENGRAQRAAIDCQDEAIDFEPVVKLSSSRSGYSMLCDRVSPSMFRLIGYPISPDDLILCPEVSSSFRTASADCCHHRDWKVIRSCGLVTTVTNIPLWGANL